MDNYIVVVNWTVYIYSCIYINFRSFMVMSSLFIELSFVLELSVSPRVVSLNNKELNILLYITDTRSVDTL